MGERLLCKQEVTGSIPVGSIYESPASEQLRALAAGSEMLADAFMEAF